MMARILVASTMLMLLSCGSEERHPHRGDAVLTNLPTLRGPSQDAGAQPAPDVNTVSGRLCIITSILAPDTCPTQAAGSDIDFSKHKITERGTTNTVAPQKDGDFALVVDGKKDAETVLQITDSEVAKGPPSLVVSVVGNTNQNAAFLDLKARADLFRAIEPIKVDQNNTATIVVYTTGAGITAESLSAGAISLYHRDGEWKPGGATGENGVVLIVGIPVVTGTDKIRIDKPASEFTAPIGKGATSFVVAP